MIHLRFALASAIFFASSGAFATEKTGQYFCVRALVGGIFVKDGKPAGNGPFTLPQDHYRFFITIEPIRRSDFQIAFCKQSVDAYLTKLARGEDYKDFDDRAMSIQLREFLGSDCFAKDRLLVKVGNNRPEEYRSYQLQFDFHGKYASGDLYVF
jgi:hypothetical protein